MTLQNINLYLPEFRRQPNWLDATRMVQAAAATLALLVIVSGWEYWQLQQLRGEMADTEQERQDVIAATNALIDQYGVQTEDPALLANIRELDASLQGKEALLQFLEGRELGNAEGFSEYLADLSRFHVQGLRLTGINLANGGRAITLAGEVLQAELVPLYLQNLSQGESYAGRDFETLQIREMRVGASGTEPVWTFEVKTLNQ
jgi:hypothetical protein